MRLNPSSRNFSEVPQATLPFAHSSIDLKSGVHYFDFPPIEKLLQTRVVVTTCIDAGMILSAGLSNIESSSRYEAYHKDKMQSAPFLHRELPQFSHLWTHLFIDEAGQASEPETVVALAVIATSFSHHDQESGPPKVILSGDHMQVNILFSTLVFWKNFI